MEHINTLSYDYSIESNGRMTKGLIAMINLPPGRWSIVCTSKDKKIPNGVIECKTVEYDGQVQGTRFVNYMDDNQRRWYINKTDSLRSLLTSRGLDLNKTFLILKKQ